MIMYFCTKCIIYTSIVIIYADNIFIVTIIAYIYIAYELCTYVMKHAL